jgi:hypothetical protein
MTIKLWFAITSADLNHRNTPSYPTDGGVTSKKTAIHTVSAIIAFWVYCCVGCYRKEITNTNKIVRMERAAASEENERKIDEETISKC